MPDFRAYIRENLPPLGVSGGREMEIIEELALEFQESYERAIRNGLSPDVAFDQVKKDARPWAELGNELQKALPEKRHGRFLEGIPRDLRYAARQLRKSPGFTLTAILTLALGIGANTAIFSLLNAVLLRSLPVPEPQQLMLFGKGEATGSTGFLPDESTQLFSYQFFRDFKRANQVFSDVAAIGSILFRAHGRVGGADLEKIDVELVSGSYFHTLGVNAILGRTLTDADDQTPGGHPVAVASYAWWQRRFGKDPAAVGRTITIGSTVYTVVGVSPPEFFGVTVERWPDLWIPLAMEREISPGWNGLDRNLFQSLHIIARQKPDVTKMQAQANTDLIFRQILRSYIGPQASQKELDHIRHAFIELTPGATGRSDFRAQFSAPLKLLMIVVALVLLIACANIANLLLARAASRQREIAVRMSMGAERSRVIRQLLVESGLLGLSGAILGVFLAWGASRALLGMVSPGSQLEPIRVTPDAVVLSFTLAVTMITVLLFGTAPAFYATRLDLARALKEGRGVIAGGNRLGRTLVAGQVALCLVLLAGAGLFLRSLRNLMDVNLGFNKNNVLMMGVDPGAAGYKTDARLESMMQRVEERVSSLPGVQAASFAYFVFDHGSFNTDNVKVPGQPELQSHPDVYHDVVGPQYLDVMNLPIVLGRGLTPHDDETSRKVAVINETMARTFFPGVSPLGRTFGFEDDEDQEPGQWQNIEVVGVVKDAKYVDLDETQMPADFFPHAQHRVHFLYNLVARYSGNPTSLFPEIRKAVAEIDPNLPVGDVTTLAQTVDDNALTKRLVAQLSTVFGILAALLACLGIYGVMSYGITRRINEFGIRMALGAQRGHVLWTVLRETLLLVLIGVAIGLAAAIASGRFVESLLFGLKANDPLSITLAVLAMVAVALFAGYLPARRATRIDPMIALRHE
jgi:predicted permease